jgi:hypothetical protein
MHLTLMVDCFRPSAAGRPMTWFSTRAKVLLACLWAVWVGMGSTVSAVEPAPGIPEGGQLLVHLTFDEVGAASAADQTGWFLGRLSPSGAALVGGGVSGGALKLSQEQDGYVVLLRHWIPKSSPFTVSLWIQLDPADPQAGGDVWTFAYGAGSLTCRQEVSGGVGGERSGTGGPLKPLEGWHHLVMTWEADGELRIFVDGIQGPPVNTGPMASDWQVGQSIVGGKELWGTGFRQGAFSGWVDDVQFYNFAIHPSHVAFLGAHPGQTLDVPRPAPPKPLTFQPSQDQGPLSCFDVDSLLLRVDGEGSVHFRYQWFRDGVAIPGSLGDWWGGTSLGLGKLQPAERVGTYWVEVSGLYTNARSPSLVVDWGPLELLSGPANVTVDVGNPARIEAVVHGRPPFHCTWYRGDLEYSTGTNTFLEFPSPKLEDSGLYRLAVTNSQGSLTSQVARLTVTSSPPMSSRSTNEVVHQMVTQGGPLRVRADATGSLPIAYEWYHDGRLLEGMVGPELVISRAELGDGGFYQARMRNAAGEGESALHLVYVAGTPGVPYLWYTSVSPRGVGRLSAAQLPYRVEITSLIPGCVARYTLDGSEPTGDSPVSPGHILLTGDSVVVARSFRDGLPVGHRVLEVFAFEKPPLPTISVQPSDQVVDEGANVRLSVSARTQGPVTYAWTREGRPEVLGDGPTLDMPSISVAQAGHYQVLVRDLGGEVLSRQVNVWVKPGSAPSWVAPAITRQPENSGNWMGRPVALSVTAEGSEPLNYTWFFNGDPVDGDSGPTLKRAQAMPSEAGAYWVVVTNAGGSVTSRVATLSVATFTSPPVIIAQPQGVTMTSSDWASLGVEVGGEGPFTYAWSINGQPIPGGGRPVLWLFDMQPSQSGEYRVVVSNSKGSVVSDPAVVIVLPPPPELLKPEIIHHPSSARVEVGESVTLRVVAQGSEPLRYAWFHNDQQISEGNSPELVLANISLQQGGTYSVRVFNQFGTAYSQGGMVMVEPKLLPPGVVPRFTGQPSGITAPEGGTAVFQAAAEGEAPLSYAWYQDSRLVSYGSVPALTLTNLSVAHAGQYWVRISNRHGAASSDRALLTVVPRPVVPPSITVQPSGITAPEGGRAVFQAAAEGKAPLWYAWYHDSRLVFDGSSSALSLPNLNAQDSGEYWVVVSNQDGSVTSDRVRLTVEPLPVVAPTITEQPQDQTVTEGDWVKLEVTVTGTEPLRFDWRAATGAPFYPGTDTLNFQAWTRHTGAYQVVITNAGGSVTSRWFQLTVRELPPPPPVVGGTVFLANRVSGRLDAPIYDVDGVTLLDGARYVVQLFAGPTGRDLSPVGVPLPFRSGAGAGYFSVGSTLIPSVAGGDLCRVQLRAWEAVAGATFAEAEATRGASGASPVFEVRTGNAGTPPSLPPDLSGLSSFALVAGGVHPPRLLGAPVGGRTWAGSPLVLEVLASGTPPLSYQWLKDGVVLSDATSALLTRESARVEDGGGYQVRVSNLLGAFTTDVVQVEVAVPVYPLELTSGAGGATTSDRGGSEHAAGSRLMVRAVPDPGYVFVGWSGDVVGSEAVVSLLMDGPKSVRASFRRSGGVVLFANRTPDGVMEAPVLAEEGLTRVEGECCSAQLYGGADEGSLVPLGDPVALGSGGEAGYVFPTVVELVAVGAGAPAVVEMRAWDRADGATYEVALAAGGRVGVSERLSLVTADPGDPGRAPTPLAGLHAFRLGRVRSPVVVRAPEAQSVVLGERLELSVVFEGHPAPRVQWQRGGKDLEGATLATLVIPAAQLEDAGSYSVRLVHPAGDVVTAPVWVEVRQVPVDAWNLGVRVFEDANADGRADEGEPGIGGVAIRLGGDGIDWTQHTDADGVANFTGLPAGMYTLEERVPGGFVVTTANLRSVVVGPEGTTGLALFGNVAVGTVTGTAFLDQDGDGSPGAMEAALSGVDVRLRQGVVTLQGRTGDDGRFRFSGVKAGVVTVEQITPAGYVLTTPGTRTVRLAAEGATAVHFGNRPRRTIAGVVYEDRNGNARRDDGENGVADVILTLRRPGGAEVLGSIRTATTGEFLFAGLAPGDYVVEETLPAGFTRALAGSPRARGTLQEGGPKALGGGVALFLAEEGVATANFRIHPVGCITGSVFDDRDRDGLPGAAEPGLAGVTLEVRQAGTGALVRRTVTDATGGYAIEGLPADGYRVSHLPTAADAASVPPILVLLDGSNAGVANFPHRPGGSVGGGGCFTTRTRTRSASRQSVAWKGFQYGCVWRGDPTATPPRAAMGPSCSWTSPRRPRLSTWRSPMTSMPRPRSRSRWIRLPAGPSPGRCSACRFWRLRVTAAGRSGRAFRSRRVLRGWTPTTTSGRISSNTRWDPRLGSPIHWCCPRGWWWGCRRGGRWLVSS